MIIWNSAVLLGLLLLITHLFSTLRNHRLVEQKLARTDTLTGALNNRTFYDLAKMELDRARRYRHPFTVATIDLDSFKEINETFGHSIGDAVLRTVSRTISANIRTADVLARLGGDEFALLLPETGPEEARALLPRLHQRITEELGKGSWDLSVSMGATIFVSYPLHVDDIIHMADQAMYRGKKDEKRAIQITVYEEELEV
jgi:diguanylate cyclase (GGDEF)-like protein